MILEQISQQIPEKVFGQIPIKMQNEFQEESLVKLLSYQEFSEVKNLETIWKISELFQGEIIE